MPGLAPRTEDDSYDDSPWFAARVFTSLSRRAQSNAPAIAGAIAGLVALLLLCCLLWLYLRRRKEVEDKEQAVDVATRPFPLSAKPGRREKPQLPRIITSFPPTASTTRNGVSKATNRAAPSKGVASRKIPTEKKERVKRRSSISESIRSLRLHVSRHAQPKPSTSKLTLDAEKAAPNSTPVPPSRSTKTKPRHKHPDPKAARRLHLRSSPQSQGYVTVSKPQPRNTSADKAPETKSRKPRPAQPAAKTSRSGRRRSSISKSLLALRWNLPPVSEGYGVGLMTRKPIGDDPPPFYQ
ncbi:hypothetical protein R3P38DRAFT_3257757 [Favolaschia claudopus]|uniref:Transmembrane protein n=1 Tax=Favolaschia claudopus TaxID=2862362 RepID=A0AAW0D5L4_9AGAR